MRAGTFVGIALRDDRLMLAAVNGASSGLEATFPATRLGEEAIRIFLEDHERPVGLAVDRALLEPALRWGSSPSAVVTVLAAGAGDPGPTILARLARSAP